MSGTYCLHIGAKAAKGDDPPTSFPTILASCAWIVGKGRTVFKGVGALPSTRRAPFNGSTGLKNDLLKKINL